MGAWSFVEPYLEWVSASSAARKRARYVGRPGVGGDGDGPHVEASGAAQGVHRRGLSRPDEQPCVHAAAAGK